MHTIAAVKSYVKESSNRNESKNITLIILTRVTFCNMQIFNKLINKLLFLINLNNRDF